MEENDSIKKNFSKPVATNRFGFFFTSFHLNWANNAFFFLHYDKLQRKFLWMQKLKLSSILCCLSIGLYPQSSTQQIFMGFQSTLQGVTSCQQYSVNEIDSFNGKIFHYQRFNFNLTNLLGERSDLLQLIPVFFLGSIWLKIPSLNILLHLMLQNEKNYP